MNSMKASSVSSSASSSVREESGTTPASGTKGRPLHGAKPPGPRHPGAWSTWRWLNGPYAYLDDLQALPGVQPGPVGVVGFCMGGRLAVRAAGLAPGRVAACAGFHVSGLVTDQPDSPHLVIAGSTAEYLFAHADNDRGLTPADSAALGDTIARAGLRGTSEIYAGSMHGYTMADTAAWNEAAYHRAMDELRALFARTLGESEAA